MTRTATKQAEGLDTLNKTTGGALTTKAKRKPKATPPAPEEPKEWGRPWQCRDMDTFTAVFNQLMWSAGGQLGTTEQQLRSFKGMMALLNPQDGTETLLCVQAVQAHYAASECLRRGWIPEQPADIAAGLRNAAAKFMRVYREHIEALDKHRNRGQQKITVQHQHVNVGNGGQAMIAGNVEGRG